MSGSLHAFLTASAAVCLLGAGISSGADLETKSGKELYAQFCAACHGEQGRGDGRVAASLKVEVPDLTLLARRNGGSFPRERIERIVDGRHILGAHGTRTMPIWGEDLSRSQPGNPDAERATRLVTQRLTEYLGSLQRPATASTQDSASDSSSGRDTARRP